MAEPHAFLVAAKRTPIGRSHAEKGVLRDVRADQLLATLMQDFRRQGLPVDDADDVYIGCVGQHLEQGKNIARLALLLAGLPERIPGVTINRLCGSSLQALNFATMAIESGAARLILAGGVEHMQHVPMGAALDYNATLLKRYEFPFPNMGLTAEKLAHDFGISRREQDGFSLRSHQRVARAQARGSLAAEIVPITAPQGRVEQDQCPRPDCNADALGHLKPAFADGGSVTAGNSAPLSDGASLTLLASESACTQYGLRKGAQVMAASVVGVPPCDMGLGPVPAVRRLLRDAGLPVSAIDRFELNEAFSVQALACIRELKLDPRKVNPDGGAVALGHPLGCTGTRLITTLLHGLERDDGEHGIATLCVGHGQGMATLIRRAA